MDLKRSRTKTIALILTDLSGPYYSELIRSVQEVALTNGYDLIACSSIGGRDSTAVKFLREKRADGAIILAPNIRDEVLIETSGPQFPIVVMDRPLCSEYLVNVLVDGEQGGYTATRYLLENGHRHVAYISGSSDSYDNHLRYQGYLRALAEAGLEEQSKWRLSGNFVREGGYNATKMMIMQGSLPSAVFYGNDEMAIGGLKAFEESGISVPDDVSVIGYDDIQLAEYVNPPLTTIKQPKSEAGSLAAHLLFQILGGESVKQSYMLTTEMMERASAGKSKIEN